MKYDAVSKRLVEIGRESIISWFTGLEAEEIQLLEELPQETISLRSSDFPVLVRQRSGERVIVLMEFQTRWSEDLPLRVLEYTVRFMRRHRLPVIPVVVLFRRSGQAVDSYSDDFISFRFKLVRMWQIKGDVKLYPFVGVMDSGEEEIIKAEEEIYRSDLDSLIKADLLTSLTILTGMKDEEMASRLLARRRDIMIESPIYDLIKSEGYAEGVKEGIREGMKEGMKEGIKEGIKEGMKEGIRRAIGETLEIRFRDVPLSILERINGIEDEGKLRQLHRHAVLCGSLDEFIRALDERGSR